MGPHAGIEARRDVFRRVRQMLMLIRTIRPTLSAGNAALHRGYIDAYYGAERPRMHVSDPAYRCYMLGWTEGSLARAAASN